MTRYHHHHRILPSSSRSSRVLSAHGSNRCAKGNDCIFLHELCANQKEYDDLSKPWSLRTPRGQGTPRTAKNSKGKESDSPRPRSPRGTICAAAAMICQKGDTCPGRPAPTGNGSCQKLHCSEEERAAWKLKKEKAEKKEAAAKAPKET